MADSTGKRNSTALYGGSTFYAAGASVKPTKVTTKGRRTSGPTQDPDPDKRPRAVAPLPKSDSQVGRSRTPSVATTAAPDEVSAGRIAKALSVTSTVISQQRSGSQWSGEERIAPAESPPAPTELCGVGPAIAPDVRHRVERAVARSIAAAAAWDGEQAMKAHGTSTAPVQRTAAATSLPLASMVPEDAVPPPVRLSAARQREAMERLARPQRVPVALHESIALGIPPIRAATPAIGASGPMSVSASPTPPRRAMTPQGLGRFGAPPSDPVEAYVQAEQDAFAARKDAQQWAIAERNATHWQHLLDVRARCGAQRRAKLQRHQQEITEKNARFLAPIDRCTTAAEADALRAESFAVAATHALFLSTVHHAMACAAAERRMRCLFVPVCLLWLLRRRRLTQRYAMAWRLRARRPSLGELKVLLPSTAQWPAWKLARVRDTLRPTYTAPGSYLVLEGEPITGLHIIVKGSVEVVQKRRGQSHERQLGLRGPGTVHGADALRPERHTFFAALRAVQPVVAWSISRLAFLVACCRMPPAGAAEAGESGGAEHSIPAAKLRECPSFSGLAPPVLDELLAHAPRKHWDRGEELYSAGDESRHVFVVLHGTVEIAVPRIPAAYLALHNATTRSPSLALSTQHSTPPRAPQGKPEGTPAKKAQGGLAVAAAIANRSQRSPQQHRHGPHASHGSPQGTHAHAHAHTHAHTHTHLHSHDRGLQRRSSAGGVAGGVPKNYANPGDVIGEDGALFADRRSDTATAITEVSALVVPAGLLLARMYTDPAALWGALSLLNERRAARLETPPTSALQGIVAGHIAHAVHAVMKPVVASQGSTDSLPFDKGFVIITRGTVALPDDADCPVYDAPCAIGTPDVLDAEPFSTAVVHRCVTRVDAFAVSREALLRRLRCPEGLDAMAVFGPRSNLHHKHGDGKGAMLASLAAPP